MIFLKLAEQLWVAWLEQGHGEDGMTFNPFFSHHTPDNKNAPFPKATFESSPPRGAIFTGTTVWQERVKSAPHAVALIPIATASPYY